MRLFCSAHHIGVVLAAPVLVVAVMLGVHEFTHPSGHIAPGPNGAPYYPTDYLVPVVVAALALALYVATRTVGWLLARIVKLVRT